MLALLHRKPDYGVLQNDRCYLIPPLFHAYSLVVWMDILARASTLVLPAAKTWPPTNQDIIENIESSDANVCW